MTDPLADIYLPLNTVTIVTTEPGPQGETGPQGIQGERGPQGLQGPPVNAVLKGEVSYNPLDYGVVGDGVTDDTAALNSFFSLIGANVTVEWPAGTFLVSPDADGYMLIIENPGIRFKGAGRESTTIKVADGVDDYIAVISDGRPSGFADLTGFVFEDIEIDQNSANNPMADVSVSTGPIFNGFPRLAIRVYNGDNGSIINSKFSNCDNINTIAVNGGTGVVDKWTFQSNLFLNTGDGDIHDHSSIYFHGDTVSVVNNVFIGASSATETAAVAAIETHGPNQMVTGNFVKDYYGIGNLTGVSATNSVGVTWDNNVGRGMGVGLALWAYDYGGISGYALDGVVVSKTNVEIDYDKWSAVVGFRFGIGLAPGSTGVCRNVQIIDNDIFYKSYAETPVSNDNASAGILWYRTATVTEGTEDTDITIARNRITAPLACGVHFEPNIAVKRIKISDIDVIDCGNGAPSSTYRMAVRYNTAALGSDDIEISKIRAIDTLGTHKLVNVVDASSTSTLTNGRLTDNTYRCADGTTSLVVHKVHASSGWYTRHDVDAYTANTGLFQAGSKVIDKATGTEYVQTAYPTGSTWTAYQLAGFRTVRFRAGYWYSAPDIRGAVSAQVTIKDQVYYAPFYVGETATFGEMNVTVSTGQASTTIRVGIYADNGHGAPTGSPIVDAGTQASTGAATLVFTISQQLTPGLYWVACVSQGGTTQPTVYHTIQPTPAVGTSSSAANAVIGRSCYIQSSVTGALTTYSESGQGAFAPVVTLKVASVP